MVRRSERACLIDTEEHGYTAGRRLSTEGWMRSVRVWLGLGLLAWSLSVPAQAGRMYVVDGTSADANHLHAQVQQYARALCRDDVPAAQVVYQGQAHRVLAASVLVLAKKGGPSFWGHAGLRFLSCVDGVLQDTMYEYFRVGPRTLQLCQEIIVFLDPTDQCHGARVGFDRPDALFNDFRLSKWRGRA